MMPDGVDIGPARLSRRHRKGPIQYLDLSPDLILGALPSLL